MKNGRGSSRKVSMSKRSSGHVRPSSLRCADVHGFDQRQNDKKNCTRQLLAHLIIQCIVQSVFGSKVWNATRDRYSRSHKCDDVVFARKEASDTCEFLLKRLIIMEHSIHIDMFDDDVCVPIICHVEVPERRYATTNCLY